MRVGCAPIVAFGYNRPNHLKTMLISLGQNELSAESDLYIYCDGPKKDASQEDLRNIQMVRAVARNVTGFKSVHVIEKAENEGLDPSEINAVTEIINRYGKVIVLEDDLVLNKFFLRYMNEALNFYTEEKCVYQISAYVDNYECATKIRRGGYSQTIAPKVGAGALG